MKDNCWWLTFHRGMISPESGPNFLLPRNNGTKPRTLALDFFFFLFFFYLFIFSVHHIHLADIQIKTKTLALAARRTPCACQSSFAQSMPSATGDPSMQKDPLAP